MIKKVTDKIDLSGVNSPLLPLIYCDFNFNSGDSEGVYFQYNEKNELTSLFSLKNAMVTLLCMKDADIPELAMFFEFLGVCEILSDYPLDEHYERVHLFKTKARSVTGCNVEFLSEFSESCEYRGIYDLLSESNGVFPRWYGVFSRKINASVACGAYKKVDGHIVSAVTATAVYDNTAIISGVFTDSEYRGKGYACECVKAVIDQLYKRNTDSIYLWCEAEKIPFYEKLGFNIFGEIYLRKV